jgi:ribosomal-protein-alanine N-acetyltransferase
MTISLPLPLFSTTRLLCRRWVLEDFDALYQVYSDPEVMRWVGNGEPLTQSACHQWFKVTEANYAKRGYGMFALEDTESGLVVGFCGLVHPGGQPEPEVKYAFLRSCWRKGYASESVPALLAYGAANHGLLHIIGTVAPDNLASQRVLVRSGMRLTCQRQNEDGSLTDVYHWRARDNAPCGC